MKTIEEILATDDAHSEEVEVPEWETKLRVYSMTATERSEIERNWSKKEAGNDPAAFRLDVITRTLKKPDGTAFGTPEQMKALLGKNAAAIEKLFEAGCKISGLSKKDVKELEKN